MTQKPRRIRLDYLIDDTARRAIAAYGFSRSITNDIPADSRGRATDAGVRYWMEETLYLALDDLTATYVCVDELGCQAPGPHDEHDEPIREERGV